MHLRTIRRSITPQPSIYPTFGTSSSLSTLSKSIHQRAILTMTVEEVSRSSQTFWEIDFFFAFSFLVYISSKVYRLHLDGSAGDVCLVPGRRVINNQCREIP